MGMGDVMRLYRCRFAVLECRGMVEMVLEFVQQCDEQNGDGWQCIACEGPFIKRV